MARFVDLGDEAENSVVLEEAQKLRGKLQRAALNSRNGEASQAKPTPAPVRAQNAATRAFQCYPIVIAIVSSIDLTTLDSLARTSMHIHNGLIQYRSTLIAATLRCINEEIPIDKDETIRYRARANVDDGRNHGGKGSTCARDLVGECRRCGEVVCRNCAIKPPAPMGLRDRHRRLCMADAAAPLAFLAKPALDPGLPLESEAIQRSICKCDVEGVWLCQPCGRSIRETDREYHRIWRWRSHYGEVLGGLGTGIGDGDRGVICGRDADCIASKEREHEIDCDAEDAREEDLLLHQTPSPDHLHVNPIDLYMSDRSRTPSPQLGPGYARHEIEGIGGVVKRKLVRMVRVGACVPEFEDERGAGRKAMGREVHGTRRSWCGWCWRVIPAQAECVRKTV